MYRKFSCSCTAMCVCPCHVKITQFLNSVSLSHRFSMPSLVSMMLEIWLKRSTSWSSGNLLRPGDGSTRSRRKGRLLQRLGSSIRYPGIVK